MIAAREGASNRLIDVEDLTEEEIKTLHKHYLAKKDLSLTHSHSIEEAAVRHQAKHAKQILDPGP